MKLWTVPDILGLAQKTRKKFIKVIIPCSEEVGTTLLENQLLKGLIEPYQSIFTESGNIIKNIEEKIKDIATENQTKIKNYLSHINQESKIEQEINIYMQVFKKVTHICLEGNKQQWTISLILFHHSLYQTLTQLLNFLEDYKIRLKKYQLDCESLMTVLNYLEQNNHLYLPNFYQHLNTIYHTYSNNLPLLLNKIITPQEEETWKSISKRSEDYQTREIRDKFLQEQFQQLRTNDPTKQGIRETYINNLPTNQLKEISHNEKNENLYYDSITQCRYSNDKEIQNWENITLVKYCGDKEILTIPEGVNVIWSEAFQENKTLKYIFLSDDITRINSSAFYNCQNLQFLHLPSHIKNIEDRAFYNCKSLHTVLIPKSIIKCWEKIFWVPQNWKKVGMKILFIETGGQNNGVNEQINLCISQDAITYVLPERPTNP